MEVPTLIDLGLHCLPMSLKINGSGYYNSVFFTKVKKKAKIRNRYTQIPHLTRDTILESGKNTRKHHTQGSQEVSPFPTGDHKAARNIHLKCLFLAAL